MTLPRWCASIRRRAFHTTCRNQRLVKHTARNTGICCSTGDIVIFTDDDLRLRSSGWKPCVTQSSKKGATLSLAVSSFAASSETWMTMTHRAWLASTERLDASEPSEIVGANMAFARCHWMLSLPLTPSWAPGALGYGDEHLVFVSVEEGGSEDCTPMGLRYLHCFDERRLSRANWLRAAKTLSMPIWIVIGGTNRFRSSPFASSAGWPITMSPVS